MDGWVIFLIVFIVLLLLGAGIGIGVYFYYKDRKKTPTNGGGNTGGGNTGGNTGGGNTGGGNTGNTGGNGGFTGLTGGRGNFSISPDISPGFYLSIDDSSTTTVPSIIVTNDRSKRCDRYSWQNPSSVPVFGTTGTVNTPLISNANPSTIPTFVGDFPGLLSTNGIQNPISGSTYYDLILTQARYTNPTVAMGQSWNYNTTNKTWCSAISPSVCLYYNTDGSVVAKDIDPSDRRFQWNLIPTLTSPNCSPA